MTTTTKRPYRRRSDSEMIADLEAKISGLRKKIESKTRPDQPLFREIPKIQRRLRKFAQMAAGLGRPDIANSTAAFMAGLERMLEVPPDEPPRRRGRGEEREMSADLDDDDLG